MGLGSVQAARGARVVRLLCMNHRAESVEAGSFDAGRSRAWWMVAWGVAMAVVGLATIVRLRMNMAGAAARSDARTRRCFGRSKA